LNSEFQKWLANVEKGLRKVKGEKPESACRSPLLRQSQRNATLDHPIAT